MSEENGKKRLVLIDGHAMLYRAFYAFPSHLSTPQGEQSNAAYGFTRILLTVLEELEPDFLAVSFDVGRTFRHDDFDDYKANREAMPDELKSQEPMAYETLEALNVPVYTKEGFEADDVIGTIATRVGKNGNDEVEVIIVTGDMDALQLVEDDRVLVYVPGRGKKGSVLYNEGGVEEKYGLEPEQIIDMKGLAGDSSDNIPGVHGIGEKTAVKLLQSFGSVEGIYEYLDSRFTIQESRKYGPAPEDKDKGLTNSVIHKLLVGRDAALESKRLVTIVTDVAFDFALDSCVIHEYDREKAKEVFVGFGFKSLIEKLPADSFEAGVQEALF